MHAGGYHSSISDPPNTSMFTRAGDRGAPMKRRNAVQAVSEAINMLSSSLSACAAHTLLSLHTAQRK